MNGELAEGVVPGLLRELYVGRRNGTLHFVKGSEEQSLRFRRGHIVNARTNVVQERLGEILVRHGRLTEDDLARATETVLRDKRRLGEVLVELGLIDQDGLEDAVALHAHEMLAKVFSWNEGAYRFEEEVVEAPGELTLKLSTGELILEAVRAIRDPDVVRYALGDIDRVLVPSSDPILRFQKLSLTPNDGFVRSRVDGTLTVREVEQLIPLPVEDVRQSLLGLISTGVLEYAEGAGAAAAPQAIAPGDDAPVSTAAPDPGPVRVETTPEPDGAPPEETAPVTPAEGGPEDGTTADRRREIEAAWLDLKQKDHFEILGLSRDATAAEIKQAYFGLAKRFHPDVHHGMSLGDLRDKLEAVFIRLGEAYEVLRDADKRREYKERLARMRPQARRDPETAAPAAPPPAGESTDAPSPPGDDPPMDTASEGVVARAERLCAAASEAEDDPSVKQKFWEAIQLLEPIVGKLTDKTQLRARMVLARCYLENPNWVKRAEETLLAAVRDQPEAAEAYGLLGELYLGRGLRARAAGMFRRVLELRPDDRKAAAALDALEGEKDTPPDDDDGGGFLKRIFRR